MAVVEVEEVEAWEFVVNCEIVVDSEDETVDEVDSDVVDVKVVAELVESKLVMVDAAFVELAISSVELVEVKLEAALDVCVVVDEDDSLVLAEVEIVVVVVELVGIGVVGVIVFPGISTEVPFPGTCDVEAVV